MSWIESHQELARHPKTKRLARVLQEAEVAVIGRLHCLWWWALDYADDGDLSGMDASDIADACQWDGDAAAFVDALVRVRFLDQDDDGLRIHDWDDYAGRLVEKRRANVERTKRWRAEHESATNGLVMHNERAGYRATVPDPTVPDLTVPEPDLTGPEDDPAADAAVPDPVEWVWDYYKAEIQPDARVCPKEKIRARLKRFTVDELTLGIEHFAADHWWMEHNATRGGAWFFHSDARSEQFLTMEPRAAPVKAQNGVHYG